MTVNTSPLAIVELNAESQAAVDALFRLDCEVLAVEVPDFPPLCRYRFEAQLRVPWPGVEFLRQLAFVDGAPAGRLTVELTTLDNLDNAFVDVAVHPDFRRRGVGRALYQRGVELSREHGRKRIIAMTVDASLDGTPRDPAGSAFARAFGMKHALGDVRRRLDVTTLDNAKLDRLLADAWPRAAGYSLVRWTDAAPQEHVNDVAALDSQFVDEAPMGDLRIEPENFDADRVRRSEDARRHYGMRSYNTGLRHDASGALVAWSQLVVAKTVPWHSWQNITLVHPAHRGHRLGILAKIINLRHLLEHEPGMRAIDTWNADVNKHMIAINEAMGFRAVDAWANWQIEI